MNKVVQTPKEQASAVKRKTARKQATHPLKKSKQREEPKDEEEIPEDEIEGDEEFGSEELSDYDEDDFDEDEEDDEDLEMEDGDEEYDDENEDEESDPVKGESPEMKQIKKSLANGDNKEDENTPKETSARFFVGQLPINQIINELKAFLVEKGIDVQKIEGWRRPICFITVDETQKEKLSALNGTSFKGNPLRIETDTKYTRVVFSDLDVKSVKAADLRLSTGGHRALVVKKKKVGYVTLPTTAAAVALVEQGTITINECTMSVNAVNPQLLKRTTLKVGRGRGISKSRGVRGVRRSVRGNHTVRGLHRGRGGARGSRNIRGDRDGRGNSRGRGRESSRGRGSSRGRDRGSSRGSVRGSSRGRDRGSSRGLGGSRSEARTAWKQKPLSHTDS